MSKPRATWKGELRWGEVRLPVRLYSATTDGGAVSLTSLCGIEDDGAPCLKRLRSNLVCPTHRSVGREDVRKGYEYEAGRYLALSDDELAALAPGGEKEISVEHCAPASQGIPLHRDKPYYLAPDGPLAETKYAVLRAALAREQAVAIGQVTLFGRRRWVEIGGHGWGMVLWTLRPHSHVRDAAAYLGDVPDPGTAPASDVQLAARLVRKSTRPFEPQCIVDEQERALADLIERRVRGLVDAGGGGGEAGSLREALRASVAEADPPASQSTRRRGGKARARVPAGEG